MHQIIYISTPALNITDAVLDNMLIAARTANEAHGITGMLLYFNNSFLQAMEGEKAAVARLYENIKKDKRHTDVVTILKKDIKARQFSDWTMGYAKTDMEDVRELEGFARLDRAVDIDRFLEEDGLAGKVLQSFYKLNVPRNVHLPQT